MATFGYGRVSTADQTAENQKLEIEKAGYQVDFWFSDTVSGKTSASQRPKFSQLLLQIRNGETLVVSKLDRLGRDAQDVSGTLRMLSSRNIKVIVLQLGMLDLTSPAGKLMLTMLAAVAEMERDLLVERTQAGLARAKAEGKTLGRKRKTTAEQDKEIKNAWSLGCWTASALARQYGISRATVAAIIDREAGLS